MQQTGIYNDIVGEGGVNLQDKYAHGIRTLLGIHTAGFPNLFIMGGYQASFQFNLTEMLQTQGDHVAACIDCVESNGHHALDVKDAAEEWWVQNVDPGTEAKPAGRKNARLATTTLRATSNAVRTAITTAALDVTSRTMGQVRHKMEENFHLAAKRT